MEAAELLARGASNRRNPTLTEHAVHILPYRGLGTGIPRALHDWPTTKLVDDPAGNQFKAMLHRPAPASGTGGAAPGVTPGVTPEVTPGVTGEVHRLQAVMAGEMKRAEIQRAMKLRDEKHFREAYLKPALLAGLIEMTVTDKPNSRLQRYVLTGAGAQLKLAMGRSGEQE